MIWLVVITNVVIFFPGYVSSMTREACFAPFNWNDCGAPPKEVLYYWKPGSRCEVAIWKGCLPNINMFHDEYECIDTCIFGRTAHPEDYHLQEDDDKYDYLYVIDEVNETENVSNESNVTEVDNGTNETEDNGTNDTAPTTPTTTTTTTTEKKGNVNG